MQVFCWLGGFTYTLFSCRCVPLRDGGPVLGRWLFLFVCALVFTFLWFGALRVLVRVLRVLVLIDNLAVLFLNFSRAPRTLPGSRGDGHGTRLLVGFALAWLHVVCRVPQCTNCFTLNEHCCRIPGPPPRTGGDARHRCFWSEVVFLTLRRSGSREGRTTPLRGDKISRGSPAPGPTGSTWALERSDERHAQQGAPFLKPVGTDPITCLLAGILAVPYF